MILRYLSKKFIVNFLIVFFIFFIDRTSKKLVINYSKENIGGELYSSDYLNINLIWNEGIAFGLFSFAENYFYNFLTFIILIVIFIIIRIILNSSGLKKFSLLMILGGALGNLYDRVFFSAVPDFLDLHIGNFHWFIFNIADIFITIGVIFMIFLEFIDNIRKN